MEGKGRPCAIQVTELGKPERGPPERLAQRAQCRAVPGIPRRKAPRLERRALPGLELREDVEEEDRIAIDREVLPVGHRRIAAGERDAPRRGLELAAHQLDHHGVPHGIDPADAVQRAQHASGQRRVVLARVGSVRRLGKRLLARVPIAAADRVPPQVQVRPRRQPEPRIERRAPVRRSQRLGVPLGVEPAHERIACDVGPVRAKAPLQELLHVARHREQVPAILGGRMHEEKAVLPLGFVELAGSAARRQLARRAPSEVDHGRILPRTRCAKA